MVRLTALPNEAIISGFKGSIDYYYNMGIPCARKWPRSPGKKRTPAVEAQWPAFSIAAREWSMLSETVQDAYRALAQSSGLDGRDLQVRGYLTSLYRNEIP
jgi:hypothetical protein